jgi:hypothetical protein
VANATPKYRRYAARPGGGVSWLDRSELRAETAGERPISGSVPEDEMPAQEDEVRRLRDLHDEYVWKVNAAIQADREDTAWLLIDDYLDQAMRAMTDAIVCVRPGCVLCGRPRPVVARRRHWWQRDGTRR